MEVSFLHHVRFGVLQMLLTWDAACWLAGQEWKIQHSEPRNCKIPVMKWDKAEKIIPQPRMDDLNAKDSKSMVPWCTPIFESPSTLVHYALIETPQKSGKIISTSWISRSIQFRGTKSVSKRDSRFSGFCCGWGNLRVEFKNIFAWENKHEYMKGHK